MISPTLKENAKNGTLPKQHFSNEAVHSVRGDIDLYEFCNWYSPERLDNVYRCECRLKERHSIVIGRGKNFAHDFVNGTTYHYFQFCQKFLDLPFYSALYVGHEFLAGQASAVSASTALSTLHSRSTTPDELAEQVEAGTYFIDPNVKAAYAYLCTTRHIDRRVVDSLIRSGRLYLKSIGRGYNLCFPFFEHNPTAEDFGTLTGFEIIGAMSSRRFKSIVAARDYAYFTYLGYYNPDEPCEVVCFESVIDLLSFSSLICQGAIDLKGHNLVLVSLRGLNYKIAMKAQQEFNAQAVHFFIDNDEPARNMLCSNGLNTAPADFLSTFPAVKDWNDLIVPGTVETVKPVAFDDIALGSDLPF